jgi:hypothetical protein
MNKPTNLAHLHDVDLGPPLDKDALRALIMSSPNHDIYRGLLQHLRNSAADCNRTNNTDPRLSAETRAYYSGGAGQLEEVFWDFVALQFEERSISEN